MVWCPVTSHLRSPLCSSMCPLFSCCCCSLNRNLHRQQQLQGHGGFPAARALPLCPDALFLQECRYLHGEFQGPACGRNGPYTPNVLFWCCILFFSTFVLSSLLKKFKTSRYFPTRVGRRWWPAAVSPLVSQNGFPGALSSICHHLVKLGNVDLEGQALHQLGCPSLTCRSAKRW